MADELVTASSLSQFQNGSAIVVNETYSWINNSSFYAVINPTYLSYYTNTIRRVAQWLDGYVPNFHTAQNGIFSTRIGNTLVNSIGETIFGRELLFKVTGKENKDATVRNETLKFVNEWSKANYFQEETKKAIKYALGLGTAAIKINQSKKDYWVESIRLDFCHFETNAKGDIMEFTSLLKGYADISSANKEENNYYLVERRYYKLEKKKEVVQTENGLDVECEITKKPKVMYQIRKIKGNVTTNKSFDFSMREEMRWDSIPTKIRESIKQDYNVIRVGEEKDLPFENLGVYLVTADDGNISLPNIPFGTSILENIVGYLMGYDIAYSYFFRDMYQGKGTVLVPKFMQQKPGGKFESINTPFSGLDQSMFTTYETTSQEKQIIEKIQFDLRSAEWANIRNFLIENIAMSLQLSPHTVASFLAAGGIKTATQVVSDDSSSVSFIEIRRGVFEKPLNKLLKDVCKLYGLKETAEIRFSKDGVANTDQLIQRTIGLLQAGLIDLKGALREIMIDSDEEQIEARYNAIVQDKQNQLNDQLAEASGKQLM